MTGYHCIFLGLVLVLGHGFRFSGFSRRNKPLTTLHSWEGRGLDDDLERIDSGDNMWTPLDSGPVQPLESSGEYSPSSSSSTSVDSSLGWAHNSMLSGDLFETFEGDGPLCKCGIPSRQSISRTARNPDRPFWRCDNRKGGNQGCDFFEWCDAGGTANSGAMYEDSIKGMNDAESSRRLGSGNSNTNNMNDENFLDIDLGRMRSARVRTFSGRVLVDIREFYQARSNSDYYGDMNPAPMLLPSKKGIALSLEQWQLLRCRLNEIDAAVDAALDSISGSSNNNPVSTQWSQVEQNDVSSIDFVSPDSADSDALKLDQVFPSWFDEVASLNTAKNGSDSGDLPF
jgi:hypothetical protein